MRATVQSSGEDMATLNHTPIGAVYVMPRAAAGTNSTNVFKEQPQLLLHSQHCCFQVPDATYLGKS